MKRMLLALVGVAGLVGAACVWFLTDRSGIDIVMACVCCLLGTVFLVVAWRGSREQVDRALEQVVDRTFDHII